MIFFLLTLTVAFSMDLGIHAVAGAGAEDVLEEIWKTILDVAPDYLIIHESTSATYDLNYDLYVFTTEKRGYGVIWKENGKTVAEISRPPKSPLPFRYFLMDVAAVPLERAALKKLMKGDWGKYLRLTYRSSVDEYPSFSSDGRYLLFSSDRYGGIRDIFVLDMKEGKLRRIEIPGSSEYFPSVSPDGKVILFQGSFTGNWGVYTIPFDGNLRLLKRIAGGRRVAAYMPRWVSDREVMYLMDDDGGNTLYVEDIITGVATKVSLPFKYVFSPAFSDEKLYFVGLKGADFGIYALENGTVTTVENSEYNEHDLAVSKDGWKLLFVSNRDGIYRLWMKDLRSGEVEKITSDLPYDVFYPSFHPSGKIATISVYEPGMEPDIWLVRLDGERSERAPSETGGSER